MDLDLNMDGTKDITSSPTTPTGSQSHLETSGSKDSSSKSTPTKPLLAQHSRTIPQSSPLPADLTPSFASLPITTPTKPKKKSSRQIEDKRDERKLLGSMNNIALSGREIAGRGMSELNAWSDTSKGRLDGIGLSTGIAGQSNEGRTRKELGPSIDNKDKDDRNRGDLADSLWDNAGPSNQKGMSGFVARGDGSMFGRLLGGNPEGNWNGRSSGDGIGTGTESQTNNESRNDGIDGISGVGIGNGTGAPDFVPLPDYISFSSSSSSSIDTGHSRRRGQDGIDSPAGMSGPASAIASVTGAASFVPIPSFGNTSFSSSSSSGVSGISSSRTMETDSSRSEGTKSSNSVNRIGNVRDVGRRGILTGTGDLLGCGPPSTVSLDGFSQSSGTSSSSTTSIKSTHDSRSRGCSSHISSTSRSRRLGTYTGDDEDECSSDYEDERRDTLGHLPRRIEVDGARPSPRKRKRFSAKSVTFRSARRTEPEGE